MLDSARDDVDRNRGGCGCAAKEQKEQLLAFLAGKLGRKLDVIDTALGSVRRAGLHAGAWEVVPDFGVALPDEFWLGRDT
jgi:hypothetical protein